MLVCFFWFFFFQAEDGIRDRSPSRGLGDVYKRQEQVVDSGMILEIVDALSDFLLCDHTGVAEEEITESIYYFEDHAAIHHLFSVGGSLDSMVVGEAQILHQLKESYSVAEEAGATGAIINKLLRRSFEVGKRVRTETRIGESSLSIASVSVDLARNVFGNLRDRKVLVVGAGDMAELVVTHLKAQGTSDTMVANRTYARAQELGERFGGRAVPYENLGDHLTEADIVISSTGASEPVITRSTMEEVMRRRKNRPIFLIDIA